MELDDVNVRPTLGSRIAVLQAEQTFEVFFGLQLRNIYCYFCQKNCVSQLGEH